VQSGSGRLDEIGPDTLGAGTTTTTVDALWTATAAEVTAVMAPSGLPADRERVFARWMRELGLPTKDDVTALELSRFVTGGQSRLLLIESPEPMDFTEDVVLSLVRRQRLGPVVDPRPPVFPPTLIRARTARRQLDVEAVTRSLQVVDRPDRVTVPLPDREFFPHLPGRWVDVPVDIHVLSSGDGRRALVVPVAGGAAVGLTAGPYRMSFRLDRKRWETTDATDDLNTYARESDLSFTL
jgi:hypothetical protein